MVARLISVLRDLSVGYEVILVVDGSPDDTWTIAADLANRIDAVRAVNLSRNYGQHNALVAGIREAENDVIITMDDDLQHLPEEIPLLLAALEHDELDLVYGVPHQEEHGFLRSLASRTVKTALAGALGIRAARTISAFRAFRTRLRDGFDRLSGPHASVDVALTWATSRIGAVRVRMCPRAYGRSAYTLRLLVRHALNMLFGYSAMPLRLASFLGFAAGIIGIVLAGVVLWRFASGDTTVAGFTTIACTVAIFSAAQLISIGVLGEYVGRIHGGGMGRPTYVVSERIGAAPRVGVPRQFPAVTPPPPARAESSGATPPLSPDRPAPSARAESGADER